MTRTPQLLGVLSLAMAASAAAQAVPRLGAEAAPGSAGLVGLELVASLAVPANPAQVALGARSRMDLRMVRMRDVGAAEQALGLRAGRGRIGMGLRLGTRRVKNLFEDPILAASGLRVEDTDVTLAVGVRVSRRLVVGVRSTLTSSTVLGSAGRSQSTAGGLRLEVGSLAVGLLHGQLTGRTRWTAADGFRFTTQGTTITVGSLQWASRATRARPTLALEYENRRGLEPGRTARLVVGAGVLGGRVLVLGARAQPLSGDERGAALWEVGGQIRVGAFTLLAGQRFGGDPAPGDAFSIGVSIAR